MHDLPRRIGDLSAGEVAARLTEPERAEEIAEALVADRRVGLDLSLAGERRLIAAEDAGRYRDGLGAMPPASGVPAFPEPVPEALRSIVARYARAHGPFHSASRGRQRAEPRAVEPALAALEADGTVARGELRPGGSGREWCDAEVVRRLRRASLAALRREIEPADPRALGRFCPTGSTTVPPRPAGPTRCATPLATLQGLALPPAQWETEVLPPPGRRRAGGPGRAGGAGRDRLGRGAARPAGSRGRDLLP